MKALVWHGNGDVRIDDVPEPRIEQPTDIILRVTSTAIGGSDLHIYDGWVDRMERGDILGHEFMGEVVETGADVRNFRAGNRVVVPAVIACGKCFYCQRKMTSLCDNTNPEGERLEKMHGQAGAGLFGYGHLYGGYPGGQAEYVRVPYADFGPLKVPDHLEDEKVLFLSDVFPTGWMAAENANIKAGDTVAVWGCGPIGQMAIKSAWLLGADRVIAIDRVPERLSMARRQGHAETIDFSEHDVYDTLMDMTLGRGPDACIDAVGAEAHGWDTPEAVLDLVKSVLGFSTDRLQALREAIRCCRKGGTLSVAGIYLGALDKIPFGAAFAKGLNIRMGQTPVQKYMPSLLERIERGEIDPSFIITHRLKLEDAPAAYKSFHDRRQGCIKVVLNP